MDPYALIPARGGSVGIPRKNLRILAGRPLIYYAITAARAADCIERVFVTTDDDEIAEFSRSEGAEILVQPSEVSSSQSPTIDAVRWAVRSPVFNGVDKIIILRPTTPLRTSGDIDSAYQALEKRPDADSLVSVVEAPGCDPQRLKRVTNGLIQDIENEGSFPIRRQDLSPVYIRNGGIYINSVSSLGNGHMWGQNCLAYVMPQSRSVNINSDFDFDLAEWLISSKSKLE